MNLPGPRPFDTVGLGLNAVDHLAIVAQFPTVGTRMPIESYRQGGGGQVATALCAQARLGLRPKYLGKVGDDDNARFSLGSLTRHGVDVSDVVHVPGQPTQMAMILVVQGTGERTICWRKGPDMTEADFRPAMVELGRYLHIDTHHIAKNLQMARWAREHAVPVLIDAEAMRPQVDELLGLCDVVLSDATFGRQFTGQHQTRAVLRALQAHSGATLVALTMGAEGSVALVAGELVEARSYPVDVVDTTGAGDVWHGAFGYGLLRHWPVDQICRFANATAALSCRGLGGRGALPTLEEVASLMGEPLDNLPADCVRPELPGSPLLDDAWAFAREAHRGQTRDDGVTPYFPHPFRVARILCHELGVSQEAVLAAALLHDTLEDCPIERPYFEARFGPEVTRMVATLTKDDTLDKATRERRYFEGLNAASDDTVLIKVADRIDNLRQLPYSPRAGKKERYVAETRAHHVPLAARLPAASSLLLATLADIVL